MLALSGQPRLLTRPAGASCSRGPVGLPHSLPNSSCRATVRTEPPSLIAQPDCPVFIAQPNCPAQPASPTLVRPPGADLARTRQHRSDVACSSRSRDRDCQPTPDARRRARLVARGGFEPPKPLGRQIYSLLRLTAPQPRRTSGRAETRWDSESDAALAPADICYRFPVHALELAKGFEPPTG